MNQTEQQIVEWLRRDDFRRHRFAILKRLHGAWLMLTAPEKVGMAFFKWSADAIETGSYREKRDGCNASTDE